jgi:UDP-N-acetylglucosamine 3-dehydrogenase
MLRVGLIGTGRAGKNHVAAYQKLEDAQLLMVADASAEAARQVAAQSGAQVAASPEDIFRSPDVDVVDICVPTSLHREYVTSAAKAGKHVICEKPIALAVEDGQAMIDACRESGVRFFVAHPTRFLPEYRQIKVLLDSGVLGSPLAAKTWRGGRFFAGADEWIKDVAQSGSIIVEATLHDFDILRWYFGDVDRVFAIRRTAEDPAYVEYAVTTLYFKNGVVATVEGNWVYQERFYYTLDLYGAKGVMSFDSKGQMPLRLSSASVAPDGVSITHRFESPNEFDAFVAEIEHFISCIRTGETPIITPQDACRALEIGLAALKSAQTGQMISLT